MSIKASKENLAALLRGNDDANGSLSSVTVPRREPVPVAVPMQEPLLTEGGAKPYRSQGLTIYESDEEIVDNMIAHLRRNKLRIGRKTGFSLFARAGLRALDRLRQTDPAAFETMLRAALSDQL